MTRLITPAVENIKRYKAALAGLKRIRRFYDWRESSELSTKLFEVLALLDSGRPEPCIGAELAAAFFETDEGVFGHCDDSNGTLGDVYRFDAKDLFVRYATMCAGKSQLMDVIAELNRSDSFGVRSVLIENAALFLPEESMRDLIVQFQAQVRKGAARDRRRWLLLIEILARQLKDGPLFEKTRLEAWGDAPAAACLDIAEVYLESGDTVMALSWIERCPRDSDHLGDRRDQLLFDLYSKTGNTGEQSGIAWQQFRRCRSEERLAALVSVIGSTAWEKAKVDEVASILGGRELSLTDAAFLYHIGEDDAADRYLLERAAQLDGDLYGSLLPLAKTAETTGRWLTASVLYRAMLDSILRRARPNAYGAGVRHLKKLDALALRVKDWGSFEDHASYRRRLFLAHKRKVSFWSRIT